MNIGLICRCKDEYFIEEFVNYYLSEGIDHLYIIDDNSLDKTIYKNFSEYSRVTIFYEKDIIVTNFANALYKRIRSNYDWIIYVDADEFITTKRNQNNSIRHELETTFKDAHCIKVPWVMMCCNGLEKSPNSILESNIHRWNHDLEHVNKLSDHRKFRCRFNQIEVKCIFRPRYFKNIWDHHPKTPSFFRSVKVRDSIKNEASELNSFYNHLREKDVEDGFLLCYHYRIISVENCQNKLLTNSWYMNSGYNLQDLMSNDYPEVIDETLSIKSKRFRLYDLQF